MSDKLYDHEKVDKAVAMFEGEGLNASESLLASARLFTRSLEQFRKEVPEIRAEVGEERIRDFAQEELNEVIYDIQDTVPVAVRLFNSLMREPK